MVSTTQIRGGQILDASVSLTADVTGTLPIANGGTNTASLPTGLLVGAGTGAVTAVTAPSSTVVGINDVQTLNNKTLHNQKFDTLLDTAGNTILDTQANPSAVNYLAISNQSTGSQPSLIASGGDTNVGLNFLPKGNGTFRIYVATTQTPTLEAAGPDANLDLNLLPKGTGIAKSNGVALTTASNTQTMTGKSLTDPLLTANGSPTYAAGKLVYDTVNDCMTFYNSDSGISMQVGQEVWLRCRNASGSTIANGVPVYAIGQDAGTGLTTIAPAKGDAATTSVVIGLTTESIATATTGFVTLSGLVHTLDTSAFTAGVPLYVSAATAGALTATAPVGGNYRCRVGYVGVSSATVGTIFVRPSDSIKLNPRDVTVTQSATPAMNTDLGDFFEITGLAQAITSMTTNLTGTPSRGQRIWIAITGTATRAIAWGASFEASTVALPITTSSTTRIDVGFIWNSVTSKWRCTAVC